jgi:hypothetical protein
MLAEVRSASASFNLAVAHYYSHQIFLAGLSEFIVEVGKTRMRENMRVRDLVLENRAFCTSLFNLVEVKSIPDIVKNQQEVKST